MQQEPILTPNPDRFVCFPIIHHDLWAFYKKQQAAEWTAEEIDFKEEMHQVLD